MSKEKVSTAPAGSLQEANVDVAFTEKLAYGAGNFSYSIVWLPILTFMNFFWTDVCHIPAATVGIFLTVSKLWDAINDPFIANLEDRTNTKMGRYRPWMWTWIGVVIFFVLTFTKLEGVSQTVQNIWSFVMYFILVVFYTTYEMSHVSLMSAMTTNYGCRNKLASYRMVFSNVSGVFLTSIFMWMVGKFGQNNPGTGYTIACIVLSVVAIPFFLWCFYGTKERVSPAVAPKASFGEALKVVLKCKPAIVLTVAHCCWGITGGVLSAVRQYFWFYNVGDEAGFSVAMTVWLVGMAVGSFVANWVIGRFNNKRTACIGVWTFTGVMLIVMNFIPIVQNSVILFHALWFLEGTLGMIGFTGIYSMVADVVEYEQARSGSRNSAVIFAVTNFAMKAGQALVVGIFNFIVGAQGYVPGVAQNEAVLNTFNAGMHIVPGVFFLLGAFAYTFYNIDKKSHEENLAALSQ